MKKKKLNALLFTLLVVIPVYLFVTSIERVPPGKVEVIMEVSVEGEEIKLVPRPLVNTDGRGKLFFKQPKIPMLGVGYISESFDLESEMNFSTSFAFYTLEELTGRQEDGEIVSAYTIQGKVGEVMDWEKFITKLNIERLNSADTPFGVKYRNREQILADQLKYLIRSGNPENLYPGLVSEDGLIMSPGQKIDYWNHELISRRNFIVSLKDRFKFTSEEEYLSFLKNESPWYWSLGIRQFESLLNQAKDMIEFIQSPYSGGLSVQGYAGRYLSNEDYTILTNMVRRADSWERNIISTENNITDLKEQLADLDEQMETSDGELAELMFQGYMEHLENRNFRLVDIQMEELNGDFLEYIDTNVYEKLLLAVRKEKLELTLESLEDYRTEVLGSLNLDFHQLADAYRTADYLKTEYAHYMESENWEYFSTTFTKEMNAFLIANPETQIPEEDVIQMIFYNLLDYYLSLVQDKYDEQESGFSELHEALYSEIIEIPDLMNSDRDNMSTLIFNYLMADDSQLIKTAGSLISINWHIGHESELRKRLMDIKSDTLVPFFSHNEKSEDLFESGELWIAAIRDVISGEDLSEYQVYISHVIGKDETLESLADLYGIDGMDFIKHGNSSLSFRIQDDQILYNYLNAYRGVDDVYRQVKDLSLETGSIISVNKIAPYSTEWWDGRKTSQQQKDRLMKQFIYPWIDEHLPEAFEEFITSSPYLKYIENLYGVRFTDLNLIVEEKSVFSNPKIRQVDPDFYGVFNSE